MELDKKENFGEQSEELAVSKIPDSSPVVSLEKGEKREV